MSLLLKVKDEFNKLEINQSYQKSALKSLEVWLTKKEFNPYKNQIVHLINSQHFSYLLDCFYQILPFGTGGRRGEVGIGPNRINPWTIQASAQGHSQYLITKYGHKEIKKGIVLCYDNRQFYGNNFLNPQITSPVDNLTSKNLAEQAASVYAANDIKVYIFNDIRTTPELSFAIRQLKTIGGCMLSASHNPPTHNGKKVYDEFGGQLIPPFDEELIKQVENVKNIQTISLNEAKNKQLLITINQTIDQLYQQQLKKLALNQEKKIIKIVFSPLHGTGITSVFPLLRDLNYDIHLHKPTSNQSGKFENVTFNIPNPEVPQSFNTIVPFAQKINADLILSSDPDADRIGAMFKDKKNHWRFINGNQIAILILEYLIQKTQKKDALVIKTEVTTNLMTEICQKNQIKIIGDLLVGFKYIGEAINQLEKNGQIKNFLFAAEESHGYLTGNYVRDKDAAVGAIYLTELANDLKLKNKTLAEYLDMIYLKYGLFRNYLTEIRLPGAEGMTLIAKIQTSLRTTKPKKFGSFEVLKIIDFLDRKPIVSTTDFASKNCLTFYFKTPNKKIKLIRLTVRPSGTEPKIKMYFELGSQPLLKKDMNNIDLLLSKIVKKLEIDFMIYCYQLIGIKFPKRGFKLFNQMPLLDKLQYFKIENEIIKLKIIKNPNEREKKLNLLLLFLGSNPLEKIDLAFQEKYKVKIKQYLNLI